MDIKINRQLLFIASCLALGVTGMTFGIRAGILNKLGIEFKLNTSELSAITATAFWGFPLAVIIGGVIVDWLGMKKLLIMAFGAHVLAILLTIFATGFWTLFLSTLLIGIANGIVEAACNPLVASLYVNNKTTKLNHFHLWFPVGIFTGTLIVFVLNVFNISWTIQIATMLVPSFVYGFIFSKRTFPVTERVSKGISTKEMYKSLFSPLFLFMCLCMFGTAVTELFTQQWIEILLKKILDNSILILTLTTGIMIIGRAFAGPIVHKLNPAGVLLISAIISTIAMYMFSVATSETVVISAVLFGIGVCYFWPTMLGFISEYIPKSGAVGINIIGGIGMFSVSIYTIFMGGVYDNLVQKQIITQISSSADIKDYLNPHSDSPHFIILENAKKMAGPEILKITLIIPIVLVIAFTVLNIYMKSRKKSVHIHK